MQQSHVGRVLDPTRSLIDRDRLSARGPDLRAQPWTAGRPQSG